VAILVTCACGKQFQTGDEYAGRRARCPDCGRELIIPSPGPTSDVPLEPKQATDDEFASPGPYATKTSGKAITSLVLGLLSFICTIFTGIPAIIFGVLGLGDINRSKGRVQGKGLAITGIVLGGISSTVVPILILVALLVPAVQAAREAARRTQCVHNLKQIGLAMHNYNSAYGCFPPAAITDARGKPLLSWRVAILPFLENQSLYRQFKLDEPWDSPRNKALLAQMPGVYRCPSDPPVSDRSTTRYQVPTGPGTLFEGDEGTSIFAITDGTSNTLLVVEAANPVPWTKPEDVRAGQDQPPPALGSLHPGGVNALIADGSVRFLKKSVDPQVLRALTTKGGGEIIRADSY
jgi:hypothetical protein